MTDRIGSFIVILDQNIRDDDAKSTLEALQHIKGVLSVKPVVSQGFEEAVAGERCRHEVATRLRKLAIDLLTGKPV